MLRDWLPLFRLRPHYFIMVACGIALSPSPQLSYAALLVAFAYLTAAHGELVNFVYDYQIDLRNPKMRDYAHITGRIKLSSVKKASDLFLFMSLLAGAALLAINKVLLPLVILAIHSQNSYSSPPFRLKKYWWGGIVTYTTYTAILFLISASVLGAEMATAGMAALAFWLGSMSVLMLTNIPDQKYDKREGVETITLKFGVEKCIRAYLPLAMLSSALSAALIVDSAKSLYATLPFLIPAAIAVTAYLRMEEESKKNITNQTFRLGMLPYRYNMALVTLAYFLIQSR